MKRQMRLIPVMFVTAGLVILGCQSMYLQPTELANGDFLASGQTGSFFTAIQVDPRAEDSAGPQFVATGDFNNDGMTDLASAWNESQPIQIHVQQRTPDDQIVFLTIPIGGTTPIARVSGLEVEDMDGDGFDDIVVLVKDTGLIAHCDQSREDCDVTCDPGAQDCSGVTQVGGFMENALDGVVVVFYNPQDIFGEPWLGVELAQSELAGTDEDGPPEVGGYSGLAVGDIDGVNGPDIVVALNSAEGKDTDIDPPKYTISFFPNPGRTTARTPVGWSRYIIHGDSTAVSDCKIADVDGDGDNDVIATFPPARNANVRWIPNPLSFGDAGNVYGMWPAQAPIGQIATNADRLEVGDVDGDGFDDVLVRSTEGKIIQWFKKPESPSQTYIRNPWQVFTVAEFSTREPGAMALGDLTGNGRLDAAIAAEGAVAWFTPYGDDPTSTFDQWRETLIIDDSPDATSNTGTSGLSSVITDPNLGGQATGGTLVNSLVVADIDGDGLNDIVGTLDRSTLSGLSNDALVLFLNTSDELGAGN
jgi:hypothetical protein